MSKAIARHSGNALTTSIRRLTHKRSARSPVGPVKQSAVHKFVVSRASSASLKRRVHRVRISTRRSEQQKYIFKDGKVHLNDNPFALLTRKERNSTQSGVVRFVATPGIARHPKGGQS